MDRSRVGRFSYMSSIFTINPAQALRTRASHEEIGFYFMALAFFHLVITIGGLLLVHFNNLAISLFLPKLLILQPWFSLFFALWLFFWGMIIGKSKTEGSIKAGIIASLIYIFLTTCNGTLSIIEFRWYIPLAVYVAAMTLLFFLLGTFLVFICNVRSKNLEN